MSTDQYWCRRWAAKGIGCGTWPARLTAGTPGNGLGAIEVSGTSKTVGAIFLSPLLGFAGGWAVMCMIGRGPQMQFYLNQGENPTALRDLERALQEHASGDHAPTSVGS